MRMDRSLCRNCHRCADVCVSGALSAIAKRVTADELVRRVASDRAFFEQSGGGVTLSGGEPLLQPDFAFELLRRFREEKISTALDTCGMVSEEIFKEALPASELLLFDLKIMDSKLHRHFTGAENRQILHNAILAAQFVKKNPAHRLWIRTPIIPGATDTEENLHAIGDFIEKKLDGAVERWELCLFNRAALSKYEALGIEWSYQNIASLSEKRRDTLLHLASELVSCEVVNSGVVTP